MNSQIKFKIKTIVLNSDTDDAQKKVIEAYIETLSEGNSAILLATFEKYPKAVSVYADYLKELKEQDIPVSPEKMEETLASLLSKLS